MWWYSGAKRCALSRNGASGSNVIRVADPDDDDDEDDEEDTASMPFDAQLKRSMPSTSDITTTSLYLAASSTLSFR